jgi:Cdc6-like AAA superfamily ATPase
MEGTRESILNQIMAWVTNGLGQKESNAYWIYGLPGIGKTSLAHSICERLDKESNLLVGFSAEETTRI